MIEPRIAPALMPEFRVISESLGLAALERLLNQAFGVSDGESFYDDFPVWNQKDARDICRIGAYVKGELAASASVRIAGLKTGDTSLKVGLIGAVATDERWRGKGLASGVVSKCVAWATDQQASLAVLWGSEHSLYQRLGFELCGSQIRLRLSELQLQEAAGVREIRMGWDPAIFQMLKDRPDGLAHVALDENWVSSHKNVEWYWIGEKNNPSAWLAYNRGIDLQGIVHEWGGERTDFLRLLSFIAGRLPDLEILGHPEVFARYGITAPEDRAEFLCMSKILDPGLVELRGLLWFWGLDGA